MVEEATYIGTYTARRVGNSIVLTAPAAVDGRQYDCIEAENGVIIFSPAENRL